MSAALVLVVLLPLVASTTVPHRHWLPPHHLTSLDASEPLTTFFEVDRPIRPPRGSLGPCSMLVLSISLVQLHLQSVTLS
uniref:Secreted peptide n=1 Tax=Oryza brachyantha TaxID=4533 RepID=J3MIJ6_ORYBR